MAVAEKPALESWMHFPKQTLLLLLWRPLLGRQDGPTAVLVDRHTQAYLCTDMQVRGLSWDRDFFHPVTYLVLVTLLVLIWKPD